MDFKRQTFLILGVSKSGYESGKFLLKNGAKCYIYEEKTSEKIEKAKSELIKLGAIETAKEGIDDALDGADVVIISPGVPINHEIAVKSKAAGKRLIGELELGYESFTPLIVGVTGTNGKTTTVSLLNCILNESGIKSELAGNVGVPLVSKRETADGETVFVTEVSSFQLESVADFRPHIACVLNISPDHLERHYNMENYIFLKKRLLSNQRESEYSVLNYDDAVVRGFYTETKAKVKWVSVREEVDGAYLKDGELYYGKEPIISEKELPIKGEHNVYNTLFAIACAKLLKAETDKIRKAITEFKGVPYRLETVAEKSGIKFVNDSKSTNTAATITAIKSTVIPTVLILGGSEKGEKYDRLFAEIKNSAVKHAVLTGASRRNMLSAADESGFSDITVCEDFDVAVKIARLIAKDGEEVLLSPACASFDKFSGYEERGERFNKIVEGLS